MKWSEQPRGGGNFLKVADLQGREYEMRIAEIAQENVAPPDQEPEVKPIVSFVGAERKLVLNVTNGDTLASAYGDNMEDWIGQKIIVWGDPSVMFAGKRVGGVRLRLPPRAENPIAPPAHTDTGLRVEDGFKSGLVKEFTEEPTRPTDEPPF